MDCPASDAELMARARDGDTGAFTALMSGRASACHRSVRCWMSSWIALTPQGFPVSGFTPSGVEPNLGHFSGIVPCGVRDHGVHPDTPKNVSKSITVD